MRVGSSTDAEGSRRLLRWRRGKKRGHCPPRQVAAAAAGTVTTAAGATATTGGNQPPLPSMGQRRGPLGGCTPLQAPPPRPRPSPPPPPPPRIHRPLASPQNCLACTRAVAAGGGWPSAPMCGDDGQRRGCRRPPEGEGHWPPSRRGPPRSRRSRRQRRRRRRRRAVRLPPPTEGGARREDCLLCHRPRPQRRRRRRRLLAAAVLLEEARRGRAGGWPPSGILAAEAREGTAAPCPWLPGSRCCRHLRRFSARRACGRAWGEGGGGEGGEGVARPRGVRGRSGRVFALPVASGGLAP